MATNCSNKKGTTNNITSNISEINRPNTDAKKTLKRCNCCNGIGLVKTDIVLCPICQRAGDGCYRCKSGIITMPWSECENCLGLGEIKIG